MKRPPRRRMHLKDGMTMADYRRQHRRLKDYNRRLNYCLRELAFGQTQGFYTEVDGVPVHVLGDPNMSDETFAALQELIRCAIVAIENDEVGDDDDRA